MRKHFDSIRKPENSVFTGEPLPAKFDWWKRCVFEDCIWVVWDGCIMNKACITHCNCPENMELKKNPMEISLHVEKQKRWEQERKKEKHRK